MRKNTVYHIRRIFSKHYIQQMKGENKLIKIKIVINQHDQLYNYVAFTSAFKFHFDGSKAIHQIVLN